MFIRLKETLHHSPHGNYRVYALNLNACQRVTIIERSNGFHLALGVDVDDAEKHIIIQSYKTEGEAINALESMLKAFADGFPIWDARQTPNH